MVALVPQLSSLWHEDETMLQCEGRSILFWEMIDEDTKFMLLLTFLEQELLRIRSKSPRKRARHASPENSERSFCASRSAHLFNQQSAWRRKGTAAGKTVQRRKLAWKIPEGKI